MMFHTGYLPGTFKEWMVVECPKCGFEWDEPCEDAATAPLTDLEQER